MSPQKHYADVILPFPMPALFTYHIPEELLSKAGPGKRAVVQFGKRKIYTAVIRNIHTTTPEGYEVKNIQTILDDSPVVSELSFRFWDWIASYYMCTLGEVYKAALPSGLKLESESYLVLNEPVPAENTIDAKEELLLNILSSRKSLSIEEATRLLGVNNSLPSIKSLLEKNNISIFEKLKSSFKPKTEKYIRLADEYKEEERLGLVLDSLSRAPKQMALLLGYIEKSNLLSDKPVAVLKSDLLKRTGSDTAALQALIKKGILTEYEIEISRLPVYNKNLFPPKTLNEHQENALLEIQQQFIKHPVVLLHGVTSSGKTEIYIHLIKETLKQGKQVLYMLPEIALTTQIINRLKNVFGDLIGVYHSKFSDAERTETWNNVSGLTPKYQAILGVRSSIFLPFDNLGLIIVDEEHENTYKQFDPAPRYNARDAVLVLAKMHGAKVLLGSATPSVETYYNCSENKFGLAELSKRFSDIQMPEIIIADTREAKRKKLMKSHFTPQLLEQIKTSLDSGEQVILFQNRRGFSPYLTCDVCGWIPKCKHCDVSLTYHKQLNKTICHYCGYQEPHPKKCKACSSTGLQTQGFGTEKIEDDLKIYFPETAISRLDLDTTRSRKGYEQIISQFENGSVQILVGTQMVSKGLDFDKVRTVGILNADALLNFPDFRAFERSYQLMAQVSGRAGRKTKRGKVIIQTSDPVHPIIKDVCENNFSNMFTSQLAERKQFNYPPYCRLIEITLKHKKAETCKNAAEYLAGQLRKIFSHRILGPEQPLIGRINNWYLKKILLKIERDKSADKAKELVLDTSSKLLSMPSYKSVVIVFDVDPQ